MIGTLVDMVCRVSTLGDGTRAFLRCLGFISTDRPVMTFKIVGNGDSRHREAPVRATPMDLNVLLKFGSASEHGHGRNFHELLSLGESSLQ
jgi:hypothetical protein